MLFAMPLSGFAVRRDWPDGTHEFFGLTGSLRRVLRRLGRDKRSWRQGPVRPTSRIVVWLSATTFQRHQRGCRDLGCVGGLLVRRGVEVGR
ncbi:hypothetical protein GCM10022255_114730 [Dactylosporangium darangshiense]|uniref:Uncharacterized protein n=1 Tax=Dactylosporangium darangshiense TaxID=579108 RepID=A0ABP8DVT7_9ACTN